jgi:CheY-like chemotaxis protein
VVFSDIAMPELDGFDLIRHLRELPADAGGSIPAVALTAYAREEDRVRTLSAGFDMHLPKPVEPEDLISAAAHLGAAHLGANGSGVREGQGVAV